MSSINYTDTLSTTTPQATGSGHISPLGFTGGVYYDFHTFGPIRVGADLRGGITSSQKSALGVENAAGGHVGTVLGGARGSLATHIGPVKVDPYVQVSFGLVQTNYGIYTPVANQGTNRLNNFGMTGYLGADVHLAPIASLRFEGGSGAVLAGSRPNSLSGQRYSVSSGAIPLQTFSIGIVFHGRPRTD
ncbi:hypothetical protein [Terriglobus saanensis]|nr:hypothetical protein [Terriglobus saanensis]